MNLIQTDNKKGFPLNLYTIEVLQQQAQTLEKFCYLFGKEIIVTGLEPKRTAAGVVIADTYTEGWVIDDDYKLIYVPEVKLVSGRTTTDQRFELKETQIPVDFKTGAPQTGYILKEYRPVISTSTSLPTILNFSRINPLQNVNSFGVYAQLEVYLHDLNINSPYTINKLGRFGNGPQSAIKSLSQEAKENPFEITLKTLISDSKRGFLNLNLGANFLIIPNPINVSGNTYSIEIKYFTMREGNSIRVVAWKDELDYLLYQHNDSKQRAKAVVDLTIFKLY